MMESIKFILDIEIKADLSWTMLIHHNSQQDPAQTVEYCNVKCKHLQFYPILTIMQFFTVNILFCKMVLPFYEEEWYSFASVASSFDLILHPAPVAYETTVCSCTLPLGKELNSQCARVALSVQNISLLSHITSNSHLQASFIFTSTYGFCNYENIYVVLLGKHWQVTIWLDASSPDIYGCYHLGCMTDMLIINEQLKITTSSREILKCLHLFCKQHIFSKV